LDVYVPRDFFPGEALPIHFWIFGGGFVAGTAYSGGAFDGSGLAKMSRAIVVAPAFRIGLLGHMALKP
jgi:carboxylesterase type B